MPHRPARASTTDRRSNADVDWRPALDCREHPPAVRTRGSGTATREAGTPDGFESATGRPHTGHAKLKVRWRSWGEVRKGLTREHEPGVAPPEDAWPLVPCASRARWVEDLLDSTHTVKQSHRIPQDVAELNECATKKTAIGRQHAEAEHDAAAVFLKFIPARKRSARQTGHGL